MKTSRARTLTVLVLTSLALSACASNEPTSTRTGAVDVDPLAQVLAASDRALDASSMHMTFDLSMSVMGQDMTGAGEADARLGEEPQQHLTFRYDAFPGMPDGLEMEMIMDGAVMYMRVPSLEEETGFPTEWMSVDLSRTVPGYEELVQLSGQSDPTDAFAYLQGAQDAEVVGTETIGGIETTHYRATVDMEESLRELPAELREEVERSLSRYREMFGSDTFPFDVWIDGDGLLRRMSYEMSAETDEAGPFSMSMTMDVTDYGNDFELDLPAPKDVTDLTEMALP